MKKCIPKGETLLTREDFTGPLAVFYDISMQSIVGKKKTIKRWTHSLIWSYTTVSTFTWLFTLQCRKRLGLHPYCPTYNQSAFLQCSSICKPIHFSPSSIPYKTCIYLQQQAKLVWKQVDFGNHLIPSVQPILGQVMCALKTKLWAGHMILFKQGKNIFPHCPTKIWRGWGEKQLII